MLDIETIWAKQTEGSALIAALPEAEKTLVEGYCYLVTQELLKEATRQKSSVEDLVLNTYRYGMALGLALQITNGELKGR